MHALAKSLREFIRENFLFGLETEFSDDDSLLEHGIIDSTGVLELIMFLETAYELNVEDEELVPENLDTISNLARFITRKREATEMPDGPIDSKALSRDILEVTP